MRLDVHEGEVALGQRSISPSNRQADPSRDGRWRNITLSFGRNEQSLPGETEALGLCQVELKSSHWTQKSILVKGTTDLRQAGYDDRVWQLTWPLSFRKETRLQVQDHRVFGERNTALIHRWGV